MESIATGTSAIATAADPFELQVTRLRALRGPNYWRLAPVIACDLRLGDLEDVSSDDLPGFTERLLGFLPSLSEHPCSRGSAGGFVQRLHDGTHLPHILEHVALELQTLAGTPVSFGRVVRSGDPGVWWVIVEYEEEELGLQAMRDGVRLIRAGISGTRVDEQALLRNLATLYESVRLGPSTAAIVEEARRRGIPVRRLNSRSLVQLGLGKNLRRIQATLSDYTSAIAVEIAQNKDDTKRVLENMGLPVPRGLLVSNLDDALDAASELGYPVVLKPHDASQGRGIVGRLENPDALREAWEAAVNVSRRVVVEQYAAGHDYRVLVVNGKVSAAAERIPAHVTGDGKSTVRALIDAANADPRRGQGHTRTLTSLPADAETARLLARNAMDFESVPAEGQRVLLRSTANLSTGGTAIDRTDDMHPDNITACEMAAGAVGLDIAGIDIISQDISVPFRENGAVIIEVNAAPGIRMHTHPTSGNPRNVGAPILDMLYPLGSETTIPVIAVTGTNGKTTTVRLIAHLFRHTGKTVGFTTTDGVYLHNRLVMEGDMTGPFSANIILSNPAVDVAVLETARGGILRAGLGWDECDVAVMLNVSADHLGLRGINTVEQLADVKGVVVSVARRDGYAVLNGDDALVAAMRDRTSADVVFFSVREPGENQLVDEHIEQGGIAVRIEDGSFMIRRGRLRIPIADVRDVPLMMGGVALFQRENVLAAIATAYVQGTRYDDIRAGLLSFFPSAALTPGRLNLLRAGESRVLVDYAHNAAAVQGLLDMAEQLPARRRIGIITVPGDRRDEDIRAVGRLCARLDYVIIKEDADGRGRAPGEIPELLRAALVEGGLSADGIQLSGDEATAVQVGLELLNSGSGDLLIVLVDHVEQVLRQIRTFAAQASHGAA